jgi:hypothetical protein
VLIDVRGVRRGLYIFMGNKGGAIHWYRVVGMNAELEDDLHIQGPLLV